jgi:hypothetical protein
MAIIHTYPRKPKPKVEDLIVISDSESNNPVNATRSATLKSLSDIGLDKNFVFSQDVPASTWVIQHNLNKYCSVTVVDSQLTPQIVIGTVIYDSPNQCTVEFYGPSGPANFSGKAFCN